MRFKSLPEVTQKSFSARWAAFVQTLEPGIYPAVHESFWLHAFQFLNIRIGAGGMPSSESIEKAGTWIEDLLYGPAPEHGTCDCCGTDY